MPHPLRQRLFSAGFAAIAASRADRWLRAPAQGRGVILTFHHVRPPRREGGFAPNGLLEITPDFLEQVLVEARSLGFETIPLDLVPARLGQPHKNSPPFLVLTFDDGYRDVAVHARPVLDRFAAPWTMFVTTDFADGRGRLWWIELEEAIRRLDHVAVSVGEGGAIALPSRTAAEKELAFGRIYWRLRDGPEEHLRSAIGELARSAGIDGSDLVRRLCLDWDELRELAGSSSAITIGAHTLTHPMLAKHDANVVRREIGESKARIERELGVVVRHFAFPVGDPGSAGPRDFLLAREAGFATAVTTRPGHLFPAHTGHLTALPRVSVNGCFQTREAIRALLSGVPFLAWNRGRRLNVT